MIRRLTVLCGLLTLAVVVVLAMHDHTPFGAGAHGGVSHVTAIPDHPAAWPPIKPVPPTPPLRGSPPAPQPAPMGRSAQRPPAPLETIGEIARTLLNLPKILSEH